MCNSSLLYNSYTYAVYPLQLGDYTKTCIIYIIIISYIGYGQYELGKIIFVAFEAGARYSASKYVTNSFETMHIPQPVQNALQEGNVLNGFMVLFLYRIILT